MATPRSTKSADSITVPEQVLGSARLAFLEAVVDATRDAVFSVDGDGLVTSWNRSAERIFGWEEPEILGESIVAVFPAPVRPTIDWFLDVVASGDRIDRFETEVERKGGMSTPVALTLCPIIGHGVDIGGGGAAGVARDLTEQRLTQATLAETESRLRQGEALAHMGRWLWDIGSGMVQWSDELHHIHGIDPSQFNGDFDAHVALVVTGDRRRVVDALEQAVALGRVFEEEYDIVHPDGDLRHLYARAEPTIGPKGAVLGLRGIIRDTSVS